MADGPEAKMAQAFFALVSGDAGVIARYPRITLTEGITEARAFQDGDLLIAAFPIAPKDQPSQVENISVEMHICPVLKFQETYADASLEAANEFDRFRKILYAPANRKLRDPDDPDVTISDEVRDFRTSKPIIPTKAGNLRIIDMTARYESEIDPTDGTFVIR